MKHINFIFLYQLALQGHLKNSPKLIESFGEEQILKFRCSYHDRPPSLTDPQIWSKIDMESFRLNADYMDHHFFDKKTFHLLSRHETRFGGSFDDLNNEFDDSNLDNLTDRLREQYPSAESLKDCEERVYGYWQEVIAPRVRAGYRVLIVAHANTIRALVKAVDNINDDMIAHLKIPNGVPLVYTLDENLEPIQDISSYDDELGFHAKYLVSARNHKKVNQSIHLFICLSIYLLILSYIDDAI